MILSTSNDVLAKGDACNLNDHSDSPSHLRGDALKRVQRRRDCEEQLHLWQGTLLKGDEATPSDVQSDSNAPYLRVDARERMNRRRENEETIRRYQGIILKEDVDNIFVDNTTPRMNERRFAIYGGKMLPEDPGCIRSAVSKMEEATYSTTTITTRRVKRKAVNYTEEVLAIIEKDRSPAQNQTKGGNFDARHKGDAATFNHVNVKPSSTKASTIRYEKFVPCQDFNGKITRS